jgi:hypothetical protein
MRTSAFRRQLQHPIAPARRSPVEGISNWPLVRQNGDGIVGVVVGGGGGTALKFFLLWLMLFLFSAVAGWNEFLW